MAEVAEAQGAVQDSNTQAKPTTEVAQPSKTISEGKSDLAAETPKEKTLTQSEVNELVGKVKHETAEKAKREALAELQKNIAQNSPMQQQDGTNDQLDHNTMNVVKQALSQFAAQSIEQQNQAIYNQNIASVANKVEAAKTKYSDFADVTKPIMEAVGIQPQHIAILNSVDNLGDVLYEMGKNPSKFGGILNLASFNPQLAVIELNKLSTSIKQNEDAAKQPKAPDPLSQIRPSNTSADNGKMTVSELRRAKNLRA